MADDLLGEVIVEALASVGRWSDLPETGPWLYRVAVRKFASYWRVAARRSRRTIGSMANSNCVGVFRAGLNATRWRCCWKPNAEEQCRRP